MDTSRPDSEGHENESNRDSMESFDSILAQYFRQSANTNRESASSLSTRESISNRIVAFMAALDLAPSEEQLGRIVAQQETRQRGSGGAGRSAGRESRPAVTNTPLEPIPEPIHESTLPVSGSLPQQEGETSQAANVGVTAENRRLSPDLFSRVVAYDWDLKRDLPLGEFEAQVHYKVEGRPFREPFRDPRTNEVRAHERARLVFSLPQEERKLYVLNTEQWPAFQYYEPGDRLKAVFTELRDQNDKAVLDEQGSRKLVLKDLNGIDPKDLPREFETTVKYKTNLSGEGAQDCLFFSLPQEGEKLYVINTQKWEAFAGMEQGELLKGAVVDLLDGTKAVENLNLRNMVNVTPAESLLGLELNKDLKGEIDDFILYEGVKPTVRVEADDTEILEAEVIERPAELSAMTDRVERDARRDARMEATVAQYKIKPIDSDGNVSCMFWNSLKPQTRYNVAQNIIQNLGTTREIKLSFVLGGFDPVRVDLFDKSVPIPVRGEASKSVLVLGISGKDAGTGPCEVRVFPTTIALEQKMRLDQKKLKQEAGATAGESSRKPPRRGR